MFVPFSTTLPSAAFTSPVMASAISTCPLPDTPAMAKISPPRTEKDTFFTTGKPSWFFTVRFFTSRIVSLKSGSCFSTVKDTSLPTIKLAMVLVEVVDTSSTSTNLPRLRIPHRSATFLISSSLWVIRIMVFPFSRRPRIISNRNSISWGVKTAVGSSKIRISASR